MNNYIKCKYKYNLSEDESNALSGIDIESLTYVCPPIEGKVGDFLIRGNGELCHNKVEYETVKEDKIGEPGVIWNGSGYAKVKNTEWERINLTGTLKIETQIISKNTDARIKIELEFNSGFVTDCKPDILLIDNTSRLEHDKKIKELAIKRAKTMNTRWYVLYKKCVIKPLKYICIFLRYPLIYLQEILINIEHKLNKQ